MKQVEQVTIKRITYNIIKKETASDLEARKLVNVARFMKKEGIEYYLVLQRPNGKKMYFTYYFGKRYGLDAYSEVMTLL